MRVLSIVGARPQFVKLGPVDRALEQAGHQHPVLHTGQHYDDQMSAVFFRELELPRPTVTLAVGSGTHGAQTAAMLSGIEHHLAAQPPDWVLVYGDTNSTLAGAVAAVKMDLPVAHVEAGLRSFNRQMPEEHNRVLTDHAADLLLAPSQCAMRLLAAEGLASRSVLVGDVMVDVLRRVERRVRARPPALPFVPPYVVATLHRVSNTDDPGRLRQLVAALADLPLPVELLVHPRLQRRAEEFGIALTRGSLTARPPLPYVELVAAVLGAQGVVTDSGGLQKEACLLGVPCTTLREETEWSETLECGWNVLVTDLAQLAGAATRAAPATPFGSAYGDGDAAVQVVRALEAGARRR